MKSRRAFLNKHFYYEIVFYYLLILITQFIHVITYLILRTPPPVSLVVPYVKYHFPSGQIQSWYKNRLYPQFRKDYREYKCFNWEMFIQLFLQPVDDFKGCGKFHLNKTSFHNSSVGSDSAANLAGSFDSSRDTKPFEEDFFLRNFYNERNNNCSDHWSILPNPQQK